MSICRIDGLRKAIMKFMDEFRKLSRANRSLPPFTEATLQFGEVQVELAIMSEPRQIRQMFLLLPLVHHLLAEWWDRPANGLELRGPAKTPSEYRAELAGSAPARGCAKSPKTRIASPPNDNFRPRIGPRSPLSRQYRPGFGCGVPPPRLFTQPGEWLGAHSVKDRSFDGGHEQGFPQPSSLRFQGDCARAP